MLDQVQELHRLINREIEWDGSEKYGQDDRVFQGLKLRVHVRGALRQSGNPENAQQEYGKADDGYGEP
jgi:hypothetical protein